MDFPMICQILKFVIRCCHIMCLNVDVFQKNGKMTRHLVHPFSAIYNECRINVPRLLHRYIISDVHGPKIFFDISLLMTLCLVEFASRRVLTTVLMWCPITTPKCYKLP